MKHFVTLCLQFLLIRSLQYVDTAFGNHLGIDEICVGNAIVCIDALFYTMRSLGIYGYRCIRNNIKSCILVNIVAGCVCGLALIVFRKPISMLFHLTSTQNTIFIQCLGVLAIYQITFAVSDIMADYMVLNERHKLWMATEITYMSSMIGLDYLVVKLGGTLMHLYAASILCSILYSTIAIIGVKNDLKVKNVYSKQVFKEIIKYGSSTQIARGLERLMILIFNVFASKLDTEYYAIHSVCNSAILFIGYISEAIAAYNQIEVIKLDMQERLSAVCKNLKLFLPTGILLAYLTGIPMVILLHGSTDLWQCILYGCIYLTSIVGYILNENFRTYLVVNKATDYLKYGVIAGTLLRILVVMISISLKWGLVPFAAVFIFDYSLRGFIYYKYGKKVHLKNIPMKHFPRGYVNK